MALNFSQEKPNGTLLDQHQSPVGVIQNQATSQNLQGFQVIPQRDNRYLKFNCRKITQAAVRVQLSARLLQNTDYIYLYAYTIFASN
jgi:hypothetical protein